MGTPPSSGPQPVLLNESRTENSPAGGAIPPLGHLPPHCGDSGKNRVVVGVMWD
jgi:hypothetical protein